MIEIKDKSGRVLNKYQIKQKVFNRIYNVFLDFELLILTIIGNIPLHFLRLGFYRLAGIKIGQKSTIHMWARFYEPRNINIGEGTIVGDHVFLDGRDKLQIGNHVAIASQVLIYNGQHNIHSPDFEAEFGPVIVEDYVFIGPRVIILPGVRIGKGSVIAAGAVVTKDISEFSIVAGVPAQKIGQRDAKNLKYKLGRARLFQ